MHEYTITFKISTNSYLHAPNLRSFWLEKTIMFFWISRLSFKSLVILITKYKNCKIKEDKTRKKKMFHWQDI